MRSPRLMMLGTVVLLSGWLPVTITAQAPAEPGSPTPSARSHDIAVALRLGTLGIGAEVGKQLFDHVSARVGANFGSFSQNGKQQSDIAYDIHVKLKAVEALVDIYPKRRGSLHFTAGVLTNPMTVHADGQPNSTGTFTINNHVYTAAEVGTLNGEGRFPGVAPYVGLGFGTPARTGGRLKFLFDIGASIGKSKLSLTATGAQGNPTLQSDLDAQRDKTQKDVDKYVKGYPVISFGLSYHI